MKTSTILALALSMGAADAAAQTGSQTGSLSRADLRSVSPALERYAADKLANDLWKRPGLSARDRSIVTVSALIAAGQVEQIPHHLNRAMDNGLTQGYTANQKLILMSDGGDSARRLVARIGPEASMSSTGSTSRCD